MTNSDCFVFVNGLQAQALYAAIYKEDDRFRLTHVQIRVKNGKLIAEASDGHVLIKVFISPLDLTHDKLPLLVPGAVFKKVGKSERIRIDVNTGEVLLLDRRECSKLIFPERALSAAELGWSFPDTDVHFQRDFEKKGKLLRVAFTSKVLSQLARLTLGDYEMSISEVAIPIPADDRHVQSSILIERKGEFRGLIMPARMYDSPSEVELKEEDASR